MVKRIAADSELPCASRAQAKRLKYRFSWFFATFFPWSLYRRIYLRERPGLSLVGFSFRPVVPVGYDYGDLFPTKYSKE